MKLEKMFNQIRRLWIDDGRNDRDFTEQEAQLHNALDHLRKAADSLSRASQTLMDVLQSRD